MRLNISNFWMLTVLNCFIVIISAILMFEKMLYHLLSGDPFLLIVFVCLLCLLVLNIILTVLSFKTKNKAFERRNSSQQTKPSTKNALKPTTTSDTIDKGENKYMTKEDLDLNIPIIPEAPKKKEKITKETHGLSTNILNEMKKMESEDIQVVLVNCDRCKGVIPVPVPKKAILESDLPVVPISYVHSIGADKHCITLHLDHDFDIRRQRISEVVLS